MRRILAYMVCVTVVLGAGGAWAAGLPEYDSSAYCKHFAERGKGGYTAESGCMQMEQESKTVLAAMSIEPKILNYCDNFTKKGTRRSGGGGSYTVLKGCVEMEISSKKSLGQ